MTLTRRTFLRNSTAMAATAAGSVLTISPRPLYAYFGANAELLPPIEDPRIKQLTQIALDAARTSGAGYADIRLTHTKWRNYIELAGGSRLWTSIDGEMMTVGMRSLVDGYWGFVSGPIWSPDEMVRLGRASANLARTNALGKSRYVAMAPIPIVADGHWTTPVKVDPFDVSREEIYDYFGALSQARSRLSKFGMSGYNNQVFTCTEKAFGSTDGSYLTQRLFQSGMGGLGAWAYDGRYVGNLGEYISPAGLGWEMYRDQPLQEYQRALYEELKEDASLPVKPVDVGRYDVVLDASMVAGVVGSSIGAATQLDRALGYEANATGTSYITDPQAMRGTLKIGAPMLTVSANRDAPGGAATVRWDDEGVEPNTFTLIQDGMLVDFQTTRESAGWMTAWDSTGQKPVRSHGCANAPEGVDAPLAHIPNLQMTPAPGSANIASLTADMDKGILIKRGAIRMDFQQLNGYGGGATYEIKQGKRIAMLAGAGVLLRTPEFWKSVEAIGGPSSVKRYAQYSFKGEPEQHVSFSVDAVPVRVKGMTIIDKLRKA